ncbi:potassium channel family protein [Oscillospiraceae bacterium LCP25S3_E10]|nr:potassium channel family protein [Ruminococcus sp.]MDY2857089.1 potassium channel family protein [Oscillospiraceae bacterium]
MKSYKLFWNVLKRTGAVKLLCGYLLVFAAVAVAIVIVEPNINTVSDGLWYCFSVATTIGFGDYTSVTLLGRILSVLISVYSIVIIAVVPGVITSYYLESVKLRKNESTEKFLSDLERLPELSKDELEELSQKIKKFQKNRNKK